jgi:hypothetical protein
LKKGADMNVLQKHYETQEEAYPLTKQSAVNFVRPVIPALPAGTEDTVEYYSRRANEVSHLLERIRDYPSATPRWGINE